MVVASATLDVMVNVVVVAGGMMVVMKCEEHSSAPAGFHNTAVHCQYIMLIRMVGMSFILVGVLTSVTIVFDTGGIYAPQHHSSCQDHGQRQERHDRRSIYARIERDLNGKNSVKNVGFWNCKIKLTRVFLKPLMVLAISFFRTP